MIMNKKISVIALAILGFSLQSCASFNLVNPNPTVEDLTPTDLLIVGQVEVTPPFVFDPPTYEMYNGEKHVNKVLFEFYVKDTTLPADNPMLENVNVFFQNSQIQVENGGTFIISHADLPKELDLFGFFLEIFSSLDGTFPGSVKIKVPTGARAIYVGKWIYERNELFEPVNSRRVDDFDNAKREFEAKFPGIQLVRADVEILKIEERTEE